MAKTALIVKSKKEPKYKVRKHFRCSICGRPRGYMRKFGICRLCFRKMAHRGELPGIIKSSW